MLPWGAILGTSDWEEIRGTLTIHRRDYTSTRGFRVPWEELEVVAGKKKIQAALFYVLLSTAELEKCINITLV